ncbi:MAG: hypothetical protein U1F35_07510 [Steroidobacteraceae bacterium]
MRREDGGQFVGQQPVDLHLDALGLLPDAGFAQPDGATGTLGLGYRAAFQLQGHEARLRRDGERLGTFLPGNATDVVASRRQAQVWDAFV